MKDPFATSLVRRVTQENLHEFKPYLKGKPMELTEDEKKVVRAAVTASLDLRKRYVKLMTEDKKMQRKQARFIKTEIPNLKSALKKLKGGAK